MLMMFILRMGFVYRNVQVADTKNGQLKVRKDSIDMLFNTLDVLKIERRDFVPGQKSSYELFSKELQDNYFNNQIEIAQKKMTTKTDSIRNIIHESCSWNRSIYFAFGWVLHRF